MKKNNVVPLHGELKYQIDEKLPVVIEYERSPIPGSAKCSAMDVVALIGTVLIDAYRGSYDHNRIAAKFANKLFDGDTIPLDSFIPDNTEFCIRVFTEINTTPVGDKTINVPTITAIVYRPVEDFGHKFYPGLSERGNTCRGSITMTMTCGVIHILKRSGWLGSNELMDYLRKTVDAAIE